MCCEICGRKSNKYIEFMTDKCCPKCASMAAKQEPKDIWRTANVFTKAPAFGQNMEVKELKIITVRPNETTTEALIKAGFDPKESRAQIIDF